MILSFWIGFFFTFNEYSAKIFGLFYNGITIIDIVGVVR